MKKSVPQLNGQKKGEQNVHINQVLANGFL